MELLIAAISLGFLGSFHCIGMCGPIALALPIHNKTRPQKILAIISYNLGRITTYFLLGIVFGMIGQSFALFNLQQKLSVLIGVIILIGLFLPSNTLSSYNALTPVSKVLFSLKNKMASLFSEQGTRSFFSIGLLNGLLPCGIVYIALAAATVSGGILKSGGFMAAFGAGTIPFMFAISYSSDLFSIGIRNKIKRVMPILTGIVAVLLIVRGLDLGIDHLSPKLVNEKTTINAPLHKQIKCCKKK